MLPPTSAPSSPIHNLIWRNSTTALHPPRLKCGARLNRLVAAICALTHSRPGRRFVCAAAFPFACASLGTGTGTGTGTGALLWFGAVQASMIDQAMRRSGDQPL
jgi:hypothetical protein